MRRQILLSAPFLLAGLVSSASAQLTSKAVAKQPGQAADPSPIVVLETTAGPITLQLDRKNAPISTENFLRYVDEGFYDGLVFHRVMPGFMIQTGGMKDANGTLEEKTKGAYPAIKNESSNGLKHARGTLAMARKPSPNSATSQFFINHANNRALDEAPGGYTVFGKVVDGMDVVDAIAKTQTTTKGDVRGNSHDDVPVKPILIKHALRKAPG